MKITIDFVPLKSKLIDNVKKNFPDVISIDAVNDPLIPYLDPVLLFADLAYQQGFVFADAVYGFWLNQSNASTAIVLNLDRSAAYRWSQVGSENLKNFTENILPVLFDRGVLTLGVDQVYHLNLNTLSFSLDHTSINNWLIRDYTLYYGLIGWYRGLGIPQAEMDQLYALTKNVSGAQSAINLTNQVWAGIVIATAVAVTAVGAYQGFASTGAPPEETGGLSVGASTGGPPSFLSQVQAFGEEALKYGKYGAAVIGTAGTLGKEVGLIKPKQPETPQAPKQSTSAEESAEKTLMAPSGSVGLAIAGGAGLLLLLAFL